MRLIRLIQQILECRKVENGKLRLKVSHGNVSMFLNKSVSAFAPLVKKQKLSIQFDLSEDYSGYFDVDQLDKVVYNLLSNAAKDTPEGGTIVVSQAHDEEKRTFKLSVNLALIHICKNLHGYSLSALREGCSGTGYARHSLRAHN